MRGAGKTAAGRALARNLDRILIDCDERVEAARGLTIRQIFTRHGEARFRRWEREALREALAAEPAVVATGGGVVSRDDNIADLRRAGWVVFLDAEPSTLEKRIRADPGSRRGRPPLSSLPLAEEIESVLRDRRARYERAAHATVHTDHRDLAGIVEEIAVRFEEWQGRR